MAMHTSIVSKKLPTTWEHRHAKVTAVEWSGDGSFVVICQRAHCSGIDVISLRPVRFDNRDVNDGAMRSTMPM